MRIKQLFLTLTLLFTMVQGTWAWYEYAYPEKTKPQLSQSTYKGVRNIVAIKTEAELAYVTQHFDEYSDYDGGKGWWELNYSLEADLDMGTSYSWLPLGRVSYFVTDFKGIFWGNGHTIKFKTWGWDGKYQGLFASIALDAWVIGVNVVCDIDTEYNYVGAIAGYNEGDIVNCTATANITANDIYYAGGIVGANCGTEKVDRNYGNIRECRVSGTIKGLKQSIAIGGIAGANGGNITNCWVSADVSSEHENSGWFASASVGGIAGEMAGYVVCCCMTGKVSNPKDKGVGGITGFLSGTTSGGIPGSENPGRVNIGGKITHGTFYGLIENNHSRVNDYFGDGKGVVSNENLHSDDLTDDATLNAYLNSFSGNDIYREALQYPFAINVNRSGPGRMVSSVSRTRPGKTVTLTPSGDVESLDIKDADGKKVDYTYSEENDTYSFVMPKRDVNVNVTLKQDSKWAATSGNKNDPYVIDSQKRWDMFVAYVNEGNDFFGKYIRLDTDVTVTETVGRRDNYPFNYPFSGTFLGNGHTITANISSSASGSGPNEQGVAPFHYIKGATIKDLTVTGSITSASYHTAGLVGFADGTNLSENCTVTATLRLNADYAGGIIGHGLSSATTIRGCVFAGTITGVDVYADNIGGIWGWSNSGTPVLENCIEIGTYNDVPSMHPIGLQGGAGTVTGCYYLNPQRDMPKNACTLSGTMRLYTAEPSNEIYKPMTINGTTYYVPCFIAVNDVYPYTGSDITIDEPTVTVLGTTLVKGTDYTCSINPATVKDKGVYELTFTGQGDYSGTKTVNIYVTEPDIAATNGTLTSGKWMVNDDVTFENRLNISGNVILHLAEGKTLHAKKGIELSSGNTLTIEGQGTLLIDQCEENKSGIGANEVGTLVINDGTINVTGGYSGAALGGDRENVSGGSITINGGKVTANGGHGAAGIGGGYKVGGYAQKGKGICGDIVINGGQVKVTGGETDNYRAPCIGPGGHYSINNGEPSGTLTLGWTSPEDFVEGYGYILDQATLSSITFVDGKQFLRDGTSTIATADAEGINGKIVPYVYGLPGGGTEENPYTISSSDDWNKFASGVYGGNDYSGKVVKLTADISVSQKVGTITGNVPGNAFCGTFLGDGHTITATISDTSNQGTALFCYAKKATIKDLTVAGTVNGGMHAAALVGFADAYLTIENCTATATVSGASHIGGILGHPLHTNITIRGCVFSGTMMGGGTAKGAIVGWLDYTECTLTDCLYLMPEGQSTAGLDFVRMDFASVTATNCYKTTEEGTYGTQVSATVPENEIYKKVTATDGNDYYMSCTVGNVVEGYQYTGGDIAVTAPTVTAGDGIVLTAGEDFTFTPATVKEIKDDTEEDDHYTLTVSGVEAKGYYGSKSFSFIVGSGNPVTSTTTTLDNGEYAVYGDITVNSRIVINGNVTLNLPSNKTLTAKKGIELAAGNSLTIKGAGTLVVKGCDDNKSGIGAESMGTLNIEGGWLTISGGMNAPGIGSDNAATPSGTLTLGWYYTDDYIDCSSYAVSNLSFAEGKQFVVEREQIIATTDNIGGQKIIPAVVLANIGDNTAALETHNQYGISVALNDRTIYLDGDWNTLCVPFELSLNRFGLEARTLTAASIEGTTLNLTFSDPVDKLEAGVPYIIKAVEKQAGYVSGPLYDLVNPVFHNVVIDKTTHNCVFGSGDTQVSFMGTYKSTAFDAEDRSILLMGGENKLYYPTTGAGIGAQRAYFKIGGDDNALLARRLTAFNIGFGDEQTGIVSISKESGSQGVANGWYTLDGRRLQGKPMKSGVYINNGRKIVIK